MRRLPLIGIVAAAALGYGLWSSRAIPSGSDIGALAGPSRRGRLHALHVSLIRSHRAIVCRAALARGCWQPPGFCWVLWCAWVLRRQRHHFEATVSVAFTSAVFLIAAHIALVRFEPMLSSRAMADTINHIAKPWQRCHAHPLRRCGRRLFASFLHAAPGPVGQWPGQFRAVGFELSRRAARADQ